MHSMSPASDYCSARVVYRVVRALANDPSGLVVACERLAERGLASPEVIFWEIKDLFRVDARAEIALLIHETLGARSEPS
jgi:hypothetical protein